ncbi:MAG: 4Fe-4S binding protein [Nitrospirae bacterium]|nr:4Fe-4S binding protein [Nitrospirota bacterium]
MRAFIEYFAAIGRTVVTLGDGLAVTGSYFLRRPVTLQYPDRTEKPMVALLPERSRGMLEVDLDRCPGCTACETACPIGCIRIEVSKGKPRLITRFDIDLGRCMNCGLCSEPCPTECLKHTKEFEGGMYKPDLLLIHFVEQPVPVAPVKKGEPGPPPKPLGSILRRLLTDPYGRKRPAPAPAPAAAASAPAPPVAVAAPQPVSASTPPVSATPSAAPPSTPATSGGPS